jgi:molybdate transport system substrate-binding protein
MIRKMLLSLFIIPVLFFYSPSSHAEEVRLSVAASMANAFKDASRTFEARYPDITIRLNFGSSGSLARQIAQGAPADIFVSANPKWMTFLGEKEKTAKTTERILAYNTLVMVGDPAVALSSLDDLTGFKRIALGSPGSVPAGQYAKQAMEHAGVYHSLFNGNKLVMAKDVRQALLYADRKEVDVAFVYKTDALLAKNAKILLSVPVTFYDRVTYPMALTVTGEKKLSAKRFYTFLTQPDVLEILKGYGFEPAETKG